MLFLSIFSDLNTPELIAAWVGAALIAVGVVWIVLVMAALGILAMRRRAFGTEAFDPGVLEKIAEWIIEQGKKIFPKPAWGGVFFLAIGTMLLVGSLWSASGGGPSPNTTPTATATANVTPTPTP